MTDTRSVKWSPGDYVTPLIDVSGLRVFHRAKNQPTWTQRGPPLHFDSVLPPNRLEYLVGAGHEYERLQSGAGQCRPSRGYRGRSGVSDGAAIFPDRSGAAVRLRIRAGRTNRASSCFTSDKTRNMRENFLQESDWNRELSATVVRPFDTGLSAYQVSGQRLPGARSSDRRPLANAVVARRLPRPYVRADAGLAVHDHGVYLVADFPGGTLPVHRALVCDQAGLTSPRNAFGRTRREWRHTPIKLLFMRY